MVTIDIYLGFLGLTMLHVYACDNSVLLTQDVPILGMQKCIDNTVTLSLWAHMTTMVLKLVKK